MTELLTRIDERVISFGRIQDDMARKLDDHAAIAAALVQRVSVLESKSTTALQNQVETLAVTAAGIDTKVSGLDNRLRVVEGDGSRDSARWKAIFSFCWKLVGIVAAAWILYHLKLQPGP